MKNTISFGNETYSQQQLAELPMAQLVDIYNQVCELTNERKVERFATKEKAVVRVWGKIVAASALEKVESAADVVENDPATKAKRAPHGTFKGKKIVPLVNENPRRENVHGHRSMQIILDNPGLTYEEFLEKGGRPQDLRWDIACDRVKVED